MHLYLEIEVIILRKEVNLGSWTIVMSKKRVYN